MERILTLSSNPKRTSVLDLDRDPRETAAIAKLQICKILEKRYEEDAVKTILILASNPDDTTALKLNREIRTLEEQLKLGKYREEFKLLREDAVRWDDFQRKILEVKPRIVHFSGHGMGDKGLVLENDKGQTFLVSTEILSDLFKQVDSHVECVLLNACYSKEQAKAISQHINYVIGMNQEIQDDTAIAFTKGFYLALGAGESIGDAYLTGCREIRVMATGSGGDLDRKLTPVGEGSQNKAVETSQNLIPEIFEKNEPLTLFAAPKDLNISKDLAATEGLAALADFMSTPNIYEAVIVFRADFKLVCEQIERLSFYKGLHDLLHKLEIECYRNIVQEARRFPDDEMAITLLAEYEMALQGIIQEARRILSSHPAISKDTSWISKIDSAREELQGAIDAEDTRRLQKTIFLLTSFLADQPVRLNIRLTETAKTLRLSLLVDNLRSLLDPITHSALDRKKIQQFEDSINSLSDLDTQLTKLERIHDAWQIIDSILRRIETNLEKDTTELEWSWIDLKEKTELLCNDSSAPWVFPFKQCEKNLDDALVANNSTKIRRYFNVYRRAALDHFSRVDISLFQLCDRLREIGQSLALVIEKIS